MLPGWPAARSGLRVALLSDLHIGSPHWGLDHLAALVDSVNAEKPDLILLAGDYQVNGVTFADHIAIEPIAAQLGRLRAPLGVISVLGNHDWYNGGARVRAALEANGLSVLDGEARRIGASAHRAVASASSAWQTSWCGWRALRQSSLARAQGRR